MNLRRGDVVLIVLPGDLGKPRPATVVQADDIGSRLTIVVCPMSSDLEETKLLRPVVEPATTTGLRTRSQIMTDKIAAVRRVRVRSVLGRLSPEDLDRLDRALMLVLGLGR